MRKMKTFVYVADDGTPFNKEDDCVKYEAELEKERRLLTYWIVYHTPDLTEGRGLQECTLIECRCDSCAKEFMLDFCYEKFGQQIAMVQGVSPMPSWTLTEINRKRFQENNDGVEWGGTFHKAERIYVKNTYKSDRVLEYTKEPAKERI